MAAASMRGFRTPTALALKQAGLEYLLIDGTRAPRGVASRPEAEAPKAAPDPADWPADWRESLDRTRAAPLVWTYWELGLDLRGTPDPQRRELLQKLLQDLAHPAGTHCFWPVALPVQDGDGEQKLVANAPLFWEGVKLLGGRAVVILGPRILRSLALPDPMLEMPPFQQQQHQGRMLVVLPPPDTIIREPQRMQSLRAFLRHSLAPYARNPAGGEADA